MPRTIVLDDGTRLELPDGATDDDVRSVLSTRSGQPKKTPGAFGAISSAIKSAGEFLSQNVAEPAKKALEIGYDAALPSGGAVTGVNKIKQAVSDGNFLDKLAKAYDEVQQERDAERQAGGFLENLPPVRAFKEAELPARVARKLFQSIDTQQPPEPGRPSLVQQRNRMAEAAIAVDGPAREKLGLGEVPPTYGPYTPEQRTLAAKAATFNRRDATEEAGRTALPVPEKDEAVATTAAMFPVRAAASYADALVDPVGAGMMGTQVAASKLATKVLPPQAAAVANALIGAGTAGYFAKDMTSGLSSEMQAAGEQGLQEAFRDTYPRAAGTAAMLTHLASGAAKPAADVVENVRANSTIKRSMEQFDRDLVSAAAKAEKNQAENKSAYSGMTPGEIFAIAKTEKANKGAAPLERGLSVDDLGEIAKTMYGDRPDLKVVIHEDASTVPEKVTGAGEAGKKAFAEVPAFFDPETGEAHFIRDRIKDAAQLVENAAHEKTHGTVDMKPSDVAGVNEQAMKTEIEKLVEEGRLNPGWAQTLLDKTGKDFVDMVRQYEGDPNSPVKIAADEVMALAGEAMPAQPGRIQRAMASLADAIPGVKLTKMDVASLAAKQAREKAQPFQPDRPIEMRGVAPELQPRPERPVPVEQPAEQPTPASAPEVAPAPVAPEPPPLTMGVGDRVSYSTRNGKTFEGVIVKQSASGKTIRLRLDNGAEVNMSPERLTKVGEKPIEPVPAAPEPAKPTEPVPPEQPERGKYRTPEEDDAAFYKEIGLSDEQAKSVAERMPGIHPVTGFATPRHHLPAIERAQQWAEETGQPAQYVSIDVHNLGGMNAALSHVGADKALKQMADIIAQEFPDTETSRAARIHHGGDEIAVVVTGMTAEQAREAGARASQRIAEEVVKPLGLHDIPHAKSAPDGMERRRGAGIYVGVSEIVPGKTIESIRGIADNEVESQKFVRRSSDVNGTTQAATGDAAGYAGRSGAGVPPQAEGGASGEGGRGSEAVPAAQAAGAAGGSGKLASDPQTGLPDVPIGAVREALLRKAQPQRSLGTSKDEVAATLQKALDVAREQAGLPETKKDIETEQAGLDLYRRLGTAGIEDLVMSRSKRLGGTLDDHETVAAKLAVNDPEANARAMRDPEAFERRAAFLAAYRMTGTEQARSFRKRAWAPDAPIEDRAKGALYEILMDPATTGAVRYSRKAQPTEAAPDIRFSRKQEQTPEFKRWFGDWERDPTSASKVVKRSRYGEIVGPQRVYHSTDGAFNTFTAGELGFHFGDRAAADVIGGNRTIQAYLNLRLPLRMRDVGVWSRADLVLDALVRARRLTPEEAARVYRETEAIRGRLADRLSDDGYNRDPVGNRQAEYEATAPIRAALEAKGYDGIVYRNEAEGFADSYIAFRPTQIKSATGNSGAFDPANPDIRFSRPKLTEQQKSERRDLRQAEAQLKKIQTFLQKEVGVPDVESIPKEKLKDEVFMTDLVRKWSAENASLPMKARTWYLNSLVSAFKTHAANLTGNVVNFAVEYLAHRQLEARLNQMFGIDGVIPSDLKGMAGMMFKVQKRALADAELYLKTGKNRLEEKVYDADWVAQLRKQKRSFGGKSGAIIEGPTRLLGTEDAYFVSLAGHMEALVAARRIARETMGKDKVGTPEYNEAVDRMLDDYKGDAWRRGMDRAEYLTFKDETGRFVRSVLALRRQHPNLTYITPFLTTPINLISRGTEFVPGVGLIGRGVFKDIGAVRRGETETVDYKLKEKYSRLAAAQAIGVGATLTLAAMGATAFRDDNDEPFITGSEPPRKFGKAELEARRRSLQPYSVKIPFLKERISYRRIDPISTAVGLSVDLVNMTRDLARTKDYGRLLDQGKNALIGQLVGKTFLKGPGDWINWIQDEPGAQFPPFEIATGFYPNALRQIPQALDPYVRENRNYGAKDGEEGQSQIGRFLETKASRATGFPIGTAPKVNLYGEEVRKTGNPLYRLLVPFDRYGEEAGSPEGRQIDLRFLRSLDTLPEDIGELPSEMTPKMKLGARTFQMFPEDYAEAEKTRGQLLKEIAIRNGILDDPRKPLEPWMVEMLRDLATAGREQAVGKMAPKYLAMPQR